MNTLLTIIMAAALLTSQPNAKPADGLKLADGVNGSKVTYTEKVWNGGGHHEDQPAEQQPEQPVYIDEDSLPDDPTITLYQCTYDRYGNVIECLEVVE
jgi:hypothetical protein